MISGNPAPSVLVTPQDLSPATWKEDNLVGCPLPSKLKLLSSAFLTDPLPVKQLQITLSPHLGYCSVVIKHL